MGQQGESVGTGFKDQRAGLVILGVLGILSGAVCGLIGLLVVVGAFFGSAAHTPAFAAVQGVCFYLALGIAFVWLGIGSIRCRRWARALILVGASLWLVMGIFGFAVLVAMHRTFDVSLTQAFKDAGSTIPAGFITGVKIGMFAVFSVIYVLAPAVLVAFYRREAVRLTCEARDPAARWTDRIPLPVLAAGLLLGSFACGYAMAATSPVWPMFTVLLKGPWATAVILTHAVLLGVAAWGLWRLRMWAWWLGLAASLFLFASFFVYVRTAGMMDYLKAFGLDARQMKAFEGMPVFGGGAWDWLMFVYPVVFVLFMLWVRPSLRIGFR